jgi:hypothetical protein
MSLLAYSISCVDLPGLVAGCGYGISISNSYVLHVSLFPNIPILQRCNLVFYSTMRNKTSRYVSHHKLLRGQVTAAGSYEHDHVPSGFIKGEDFFDQLCEYHLLNKGSAPWSQKINKIIFRFNSSGAALSTTNGPLSFFSINIIHMSLLSRHSEICVYVHQSSFLLRDGEVVNLHAVRRGAAMCPCGERAPHQRDMLLHEFV